MFKSLLNAFHIKDMRSKLLFTFFMIVLVRLGSQIPVPGIDITYFKEWFAQNKNDAFNLISAFTGGSFERFSIFGLGITPYITASIILQLLTIAIPALEELQKDGQYGKKKMEWVTRWTAIGLAVFESLAMAIGFGRSGLLPNMGILRGIIIVVCFTCGTALLIFFGFLIDKKGIGNGISIILMVNILAELPKDFTTLYTMLIANKTIAKGILMAVIILAVVIGTVVLVVLLNEAERRVPIQYAKKITGNNKMVGAQKSFLPIKVNIASVIPIIFASSIFSIPQIVATILGRGNGSGFSKFVLGCLNQANWFDIHNLQYTLGLVLYLALVFFFAFFYTSISFNPVEIADDLKKQGGIIPGIRQGKPTVDYLTTIINRVVVIGATGLIVVVMIPLFFSSISHVSISFGGTSIIIVVGVILETLEQIESGMQVHNYRGFLAA